MAKKFPGQTAITRLCALVKAGLAGKQDKLSGAAGQVVGFGSDGTAAARNAWSNQNLLVNWYFANPIDRTRGYIVKSGVTYYSDAALSASAGTTSAAVAAKYVNSTYGTINVDGAAYYAAAADVVRGYVGNRYTIDQWKSFNANLAVTIDEDGIGFSGSTRKDWGNTIPNEAMPEGEYTVSLLTSSGKLGTATKYLSGDNTDTSKSTLVARLGDTGYHVNLRRRWNSTTSLCCFQARTDPASEKLFAAKLELGSHQTLAHQDADGRWVLNDPPPNRNLESLKCQSATAADQFDRLEDAVAGKQDKLSGAAGQVVGFGGAGTPAAMTIRAGENISVTRSGNVITISAAGGQSSGRIFTVTMSAQPAGYGSVEGGGMYQDGARCTASANPGTGYAFVGWKVDGSTVSTQASYSFTVTRDLSLTAVFEVKVIKPAYYKTAANLSTARYTLAAASVGDYALFGGGITPYDSDAVDAYSSSLVRSTPAALHEARGYSAGVSLGGYALFGGGGGSGSAAVDAYNSSLTRSVLTPLSNARSPAGTSAGNYALFGGGGSAAVDAYNTSLTRSTPTALSKGRGELAAVSTGSYALFGGGFVSGSGETAVVDAYNSSLTRTTPTALSQAREYPAAAPAGNYALFCGGYYLGSKSSIYDLVDAYNSSLTRATPTALSQARYHLAATSIGSFALFGGGSAGEDAAAAVDAYDGSLTRTTPTALSQARYRLAAASVGGFALFGGGSPNSGMSAVVDVYALQ